MSSQRAHARTEPVSVSDSPDVAGPSRETCVRSVGGGGRLSVVVVGGGIAGLSAAYELLRRGADVTVVEAAPRFGGKIETVRRDGFVLEAGPDSFVTRKPRALELVRELGLEDRLLATRPEDRRVHLLHRGRLTELPDGLAMVAPTRLGPFLKTPLLSWRGKLRAGLDLVLPARRSADDESLGAFVRRRLGPEMLERLVGPLLAGIHSTDADDLSLRSTFPLFAEIERTHGSLIRGLRAERSRRDRHPSATSARVSLENGLEELVTALVTRLEEEGAHLLCGRPVRSLIAPGDGPGEGSWRITLGGDETRTADAVVLATPARAAAALMEKTRPKLAWELRQLRAATTVTVSLAYRRADLPAPLDAYGFVVPRSEGRWITACTYTSTKLDHRCPPDHVLLRAFLGGPAGEDGLGREAWVDDDEMVRRVRDDLGSILGIAARPTTTEVRRFDAGSPQYEVGHGERVARLEEMTGPGLALAGSAYHGVGIPDCVASGARAAEELAERYAKRSAAA